VHKVILVYEKVNKLTS